MSSRGRTVRGEVLWWNRSPRLVPASGVGVKKNRPQLDQKVRTAGGSISSGVLLRRELYLREGQFHLAVHLFDRAGGRHLFGLLAQLAMELLAHIIGDQIVVLFLAILFCLDDVLALFGLLQGAFSAFAFACDRDGFAGRKGPYGR